MKAILIVLSVITALLLFSTTVCGLWIKSQNLKGTEYAESIGFHMNIGIATAVLGIITVIATIIYVLKK